MTGDRPSTASVDGDLGGRTPRVSVVIASHNGAGVICGALGSASSGPGVEVVVVDDGSTDGTAATAQECAPAASVHSQSRRGRSAARNTGASLASGDLLVFLDDDDQMASGALEEIVEVAAGPSATALIRLGVEYRRGDELEVVFPDQGRPFDGPFIPGSFAVSRRLFLEVGGYDERLSFAENSELVLRLVEALRTRGERPTLLHRIGVTHVHRIDSADHYRVARIDAVELLLRKHHTFYARHRTERATLLGIAAHDHTMQGRNGRALMLGLRSLAARPTARGAARVARILVRSVSRIIRRRWS